MSDQPAVSVVIPTYNRAYVLARTLDSVLAQSHQDFEIVIVDDGSTDGTGEMVESRYGGDPRIRYTWQENRGVTWARNRGLSLVRGAHVAFLDSDDTWKPWKLELQLACLRYFPAAGMVWTNMAAVDPDGEVIEPRFLRKMYSAYGHFTHEQLFSESVPLADVVPNLSDIVGTSRLYCGSIYPEILMGNLVHTSTVLVSAERRRQVGEFDTALEPAGEDHDFHLRTARAGPVCLADVSSILYQVGHEDALTSSAQRVFIARNNLRALDKAVAEHDGRVRLPRSLVNRAYAHVHTWLGELFLQSGDRTQARHHLARSIKLVPWQPHTAGLLALSSLPPWLGDRARRCYQWLKHAVG